MHIFRWLLYSPYTYAYVYVNLWFLYQTSSKFKHECWFPCHTFVVAKCMWCSWHIAGVPLNLHRLHFQVCGMPLLKWGRSQVWRKWRCNLHHVLFIKSRCAPSHTLPIWTLIPTNLVYPNSAGSTIDCLTRLNTGHRSCNSYI